MRRLLGIVLGCGLLGFASVVPAVAACDPACVSCISDTCVACQSGYYPSGGGTCSPCTLVVGCTSALMCTGPTNSQCSSCATGRFLDSSGLASICQPCTPVLDCTSPLTCTSASSSVCSSCTSGTYLSPSGASCPACTPVTNCTSPLTCTSASLSVCSSCTSGTYLSPSGASCPACTPVTNCTSPLTCTSVASSTCTSCTSGSYLDPSGSQCPHCTPVPNCTSPITCTDAADSQCTACAPTTPLDHYNCYKTKDLKNPKFVKQTGLTIVDAFATATVDALKPAFLCAPASQDGSSVGVPSAFLCCYKTKAPSLAAAVDAETGDDLGTLQVEIKKPGLVCEPCSATVLP